MATARVVVPHPCRGHPAQGFPGLHGTGRVADVRVRPRHVEEEPRPPRGWRIPAQPYAAGQVQRLFGPPVLHGEPHALDAYLALSCWQLAAR